MGTYCKVDRFDRPRSYCEYLVWLSKYYKFLRYGGKSESIMGRPKCSLIIRFQALPLPYML